MKALIKKIIPRDLTIKIYHLKTDLNFFMIKFFSRSGFLASLYYFIFSKEFYREQRSVLSGRIEYKSSKMKESSALLRRNIHRLEKGLIMQPRRATFASAYIGETVDCYKVALASTILCANEKKWAHDVLIEYFSIIGSDPKIDEAKSSFKKNTDFIKNEPSIPYSHKDLGDIGVNYTQLLSLFKHRRSVRWYKEKPVPMELINKAVNAATLAPSACNRQPYQFFVVNNSEKATDIAKCAMGTTGFSENIQCLIAIVGDLSAYPAERDRHVIYIDSSLAAMQLMLAFETLGLSSCSINWPDVEALEKRISEKLALEYHQRVVMLMAVGYAEPDGGIPFSQKKQHNILVKDVS
ncbi:nitroreductase family protein [Vibrio cyclitrophicus]